ncbi:MAG: alanine racemase C-terminal domain-containing protein, partial [Pseudomonadota bacterium]
AAAAAAALGRGPRTAALQVETGMNRLGCAPDALEAAAPEIAAAGALDIRLIMSHLACADAPRHPQNAAQKAAFDAAAARLRPHFPAARLSLAATGGALLGPAFAYDLIRAGVGLYGGAPFAEARPVVRLEAPLIRAWDAPEGALSGYGATWRARGPRRLATLAVGYADGIPRALSNLGDAGLHGRAAPIVGRVSMDSLVIDATDAPRPDGAPAQVGDVATLLDETRTVDALATTTGTIGYEVLTRLGGRFERRYVGG